MIVIIFYFAKKISYFPVTEQNYLPARGCTGQHWNGGIPRRLHKSCTRFDLWRRPCFIRIIVTKLRGLTKVAQGLLCQKQMMVLTISYPGEMVKNISTVSRRKSQGILRHRRFYRARCHFPGLFCPPSRLQNSNFKRSNYKGGRETSWWKPTMSTASSHHPGRPGRSSHSRDRWRLSGESQSNFGCII